MRKGYKLTEVGELPEDWDICKVKDLCSITTGSKNTEDNVPDGKYPFFVRSQKVERINSYSFDGEGVLTAGDGVGTGKIFHYINGKCDIHQRVYLMYDFNDSILPYYFFYYFKYYFYDRIMKMTAKSSVDSVRKDMIAEMRVAVPSISEQMIITSSLSGIDSLISSLEQLIAKKCLIKHGAMQELLTGEKRLPGFEGEWKNTTLEKIAIIKDGTHQTPNYVDSGIPFFSVENITNNNFKNNLKYISSEDHQQLSKNIKLRKNDILMTRIGILGKCKLIDWNCEASFYVSLALIRATDEEISPQFLFHILNSQATSKCIDALALPNAIPPKINLGSISSITISFPSIDEQAAIASVLFDMDNEIAALEAKLEKTRKIRSGMMEELLTGRIRLV